MASSDNDWTPPNPFAYLMLACSRNLGLICFSGFAGEFRA